MPADAVPHGVLTAGGGRVSPIGWDSRFRPSREMGSMSDLVFLALGGAFFILAAAFVRACARL